LTQNSFKEAGKYFLAAAERDPQFSNPLACLARVKQLEALFTWANPVEAIGESYRLALVAKGLDPFDPLALEMLGFACSMIGQHDAAIENSKRSVDLNPSYVGGHFSLGMVSLFNGQPAECAAEMETAIRLSPNDFMLPHFFATLSTAHYMMRNYEQSFEIATLAVQKGPHYPLGYRSLANALGQLGRVGEGNQALAKFLELVPGYRTELARHAAHFRHDADFEHYMDGLHRLGWKG
jgi:tetratricopeptide (TPR) repeat protein